MKLQDKIYVSSQTVSTGKVYGLWFVNSEPDTSEYIRKDAIIEILNRAKSLRDRYAGDAESIELINALINKINSL